MRDPRFLIDALLNDELLLRQNALRRAMWTEEDKDCIPDFQDDVQNIQKAISLWEKVRPRD
jgi:hypothetical protein